MDVNDYIYANVIGKNYTEVDCVIWEDMYTTARQTNGAINTAFGDYFIRASVCNDGEAVNDQIHNYVVDTFLAKTYIDMCILQDKLFNTLVCEANKKTGIEIMTYTHASGIQPATPFDPIPEVTVTKNVDFGEAIFTEKLWLEYKQAVKDYMCGMKQCMNLLTGDTFDNTTFTEFQELTLELA